MALNIRNPETEALASELARRTGETKTEAVTRALRDRLSRVQQTETGLALNVELTAIAKQCASLQVRDDRPADEILGYDEHGLPG